MSRGESSASGKGQEKGLHSAGVHKLAVERLDIYVLDFLWLHILKTFYILQSYPRSRFTLTHSYKGKQSDGRKARYTCRPDPLAKRKTNVHLTREC